MYHIHPLKEHVDLNTNNSWDGQWVQPIFLGLCPYQVEDGPGKSHHLRSPASLTCSDQWLEHGYFRWPNMSIFSMYVYTTYTCAWSKHVTYSKKQIRYIIHTTKITHYIQEYNRFMFHAHQCLTKHPEVYTSWFLSQCLASKFPNEIGLRNKIMVSDNYRKSPENKIAPQIYRQFFFYNYTFPWKGSKNWKWEFVFAVFDHFDVFSQISVVGSWKFYTWCCPCSCRGKTYSDDPLCPEIVSIIGMERFVS